MQAPISAGFGLYTGRKDIWGPGLPSCPVCQSGICQCLFPVEEGETCDPDELCLQDGFPLIFESAPWDADRVKLLIWRPVQKAICGTESTTQLKSQDIDKVAKPILEFLGKQGIGILFPSEYAKALENGTLKY